MNLKPLFIFLCILVIFELADAKSKGKKKSSESSESDSLSFSMSGSNSDSDSSEDFHEKGKHGKESKKHKGSDKKSKHEKKDKSEEKEVAETATENFLGTDPDDPAAPDIEKPIKASKELEKKFMAVLLALSNSTAENLLNVAVAAHTLIRDIQEENFGLMNAFAFIPEFLATDVPTQFQQLLRMAQKFLKKGDLRLEKAFQVLNEWAEGLVEDTAQSQMKMSSFITYWSGILGSFKKFYRATVDDVFSEIEN